ncbi:MAG: hypothetical protein Ct9H300mP19_18830 [Dehalococcoidia bacterium]|nr:MAG: hypothetical protein Ct9H300mP19_18830 [Dehalococcoidia bacterium]
MDGKYYARENGTSLAMGLTFYVAPEIEYYYDMENPGEEVRSDIVDILIKQHLMGREQT